MAIEIRPITLDEVPAFRTVVSRAFGGDATDDDEARQRFVDQVELSRTYAAFDGDSLVGSGASFSFNVSVPGGGMTPMAGLTMVAVIPTHRRRGLLNRLMRAHFDDCIERGEALSGLWASESSIYGRYGFGIAATHVDITIDGPRVGIPPAPDDVRIVDEETARTEMRQVYERVLAQRPGRLSRTDAWWEHRHIRDPEEWRRGATARRYVVAYREGQPVGYTSYRQKEKWEDAIANGSVIAGELFGIDAAATLSLWSVLCSVDLFPNVKAENLPIDLDLVHQVANPRLIKRKILDGLYIRVLDVPAALEARRYAATDSLVIQVDDPLDIAGGVFRLDTSPAGSSCQTSIDSPDVALDVTALGALYLGADGAASLGSVGRLQGTPDAVARFGRLLRSDIAPCCPEVF